MFVFLSDALYAARPRLTPHGDKSERLPADAQVLLVRLPPLAAAHLPHLVQVFWTEEGLRGSATASFGLDEVLPLGLVKRIGGAGGNVVLDKSVVALVPIGGLAGSVISGKCLMSQQEADGKNEKSLERSHHPEVQQ